MVPAMGISLLNVRNSSDVQSLKYMHFLPKHAWQSRIGLRLDGVSRISEYVTSLMSENETVN